MRTCSKSFTGKILWIDLSLQRHWEKELPENVKRLLMGGKGVGAWLLLDRLPKRVDPLAPENIVLFLTGPLTGAFAPTSSRFAVVTKSPKTGTFLDSYCGGRFGHAIKLSGYLGIGLVGCAKRPTLLQVSEDDVSFVDAGDLWGTTTFETDERLKDSFGEGWRWVTIGPAGERESPLAGVFSEGRTAGRGGAGAVLGSKNVKALMVKEEGAVSVENPKDFMETCRKAYRDLRLSSQIRKLSQEGTAKIIEALVRNGGIGTKNFQKASPENSDLFPEKWWKDVWVRNGACFACPIACSKYFHYAGRLVEGPEFETMFALGSNCGISDRRAIAQGNFLCNSYGIDTISAGGTIAFLMELSEKGFLNKGALSGLKATWGSSEDMLSLVDQIGKGELPELEKGVRHLATLFPGSEEFAMHVKGMEFPAYPPRKAPGIGLAYAISDRGACHVRGAPIAELLGLVGETSPEGEAELVVLQQDTMATMDCLILCIFALQGIGLERLSQLVEISTGLDFGGPRGLELVGRRAWTLSRLFNLREGIPPASDTLPLRCLAEQEGGPLLLDEMKRAYYCALGWSEEGYPTQGTIQQLGLGSILDFERLGIEY